MFPKYYVKTLWCFFIEIFLKFACIMYAHLYMSQWGHWEMMSTKTQLFLRFFPFIITFSSSSLPLSPNKKWKSISRRTILREKCENTKFFSCPYFPVFGLNTEIYSVNLHIYSAYRKIRTRKNSVFGHFSHAVY